MSLTKLWNFNIPKWFFKLALRVILLFREWAIFDHFFPSQSWFGVSWVRCDFKMLAHFPERLNLEKSRFIFKRHFAKVVDSYITGCLIPLISDCTSTLAFSSICSSVSEANSSAISSLLSGSASSLEVCLPSNRFLFAESREKIPGFEALKATPFYKTFMCHLSCEHCTYR